MYVNRLNSKTTLVVTILVLVSAVGANVNSTNVIGGSSRMAWMKSLLDHHKWMEFINNGTLSLPQQCEQDLKAYLKGLYDGQLWASKSKYFYITELIFC
ncbi:unnamed protein product [Arctia plantaginis]|uniref:Uncharacterized protein n=1 Tax=Arctia plantaginis TaxID=874455 RepID=A0A8S0ZXL9_ARCPL|nr:unnamed protein product [Arctia plantaginis]